MANQQLIDYIKGQTAAGVSETDIRKILKDAGWPDAEVEDGFKNSKGVSAASPAVSAVAASQPAAAKPMEAAKAEPKKESMSFDFMTNPGGMSSMPAAGTPKEKSKDAKPMAMSADLAPAGKKASSLPWIVAGVAVVLMIGVGIYFYMQSGTASSQVDTLNAANTALTSQLAALKNSTVSMDDFNSAKADAGEVSNELSLFINSGAGTSTPVRFDLNGLVGLVKAQYTLTTPHGIVLTVKNSKDAKVDAALKPLIGGTAELSGTHIAGTYEITVDSLGGAPLPTPASSTAPIASTSTKSSAGTSTSP